LLDRLPMTPSSQEVESLDFPGWFNGLLRQYFPKGTDLSVHSPERLLEVATELNERPRKTLGWITPAQAMQRLLFDPETPPVATTA